MRHLDSPVNCPIPVEFAKEDYPQNVWFYSIKEFISYVFDEHKLVWLTSELSYWLDFDYIVYTFDIAFKKAIKFFIAMYLPERTFCLI